MKKIIALLLISVLVGTSMGSIVHAEEKIPSAFWSLIKTEDALRSGDNLHAQIQNWEAIIALFDDWSDDSSQKLGIVTPRYLFIAEAYEELLDYDSAVETLERYIYYATILEEKGEWDQFARLGAEAKIINLSVDLDLYMERPVNDTDPYYGAKGEPTHGVYFGATYDRDPRILGYDRTKIESHFPKKDSHHLIYLEFGTEITDFNHYFEHAKASNTGIMLAWNAYEVYDDMSVHKDYIQRTAAYIKSLDLPVFVRYAGEFNIAEGFEDAKGFVENFKYLATEIRKQAPNAIIVWSPNEISDSTRDLMDYYPGDAYVDWVGMSSYTFYYHGTKADWGSLQESIDNQYFTGSKANPLSKVRSIIELFGDRKPIMLSENGIAHYSKMADEDFTNWAKVQLRRAYDYIPLKYPQVKAMFYFNTDDNVTKNNSYALYENETINELYNSIVSNNQFLSQHGATSESIFGKLASNVTIHLPEQETYAFKTYTILPDSLEAKVIYTLNGNQIAERNEIPYTYTLNSEKLKIGENTLTIDAYNSDGQKIKSKSYTLEYTADRPSDWAKDAIARLAQKNLLEEDTFKNYQDTISREKFIYLAVRLYEALKNESVVIDPTLSFKDTTDSYALKGATIGITKGTSTDTFSPELDLSRETLATLFMRTLALTDAEIKPADKELFADHDSISSWALESIYLAKSNGILSGTGNGKVSPQDTATVEQALMILNRILESQL